MTFYPITTEASGARPLSVTYRAITTLTPDPRNARTHPKRQVEQLVASMKAFGFTNPVLIDESGAVIAGHGRLLAAKALGLAEVPTIELGGLREPQKRALRLADNKIALGSGWDVAILKVELSELAALELDFDLQVTGFSLDALDSLPRGKRKSERMPPVPVEPSANGHEVGGQDPSEQADHICEACSGEAGALARKLRDLMLPYLEAWNQKEGAGDAAFDRCSNAFELADFLSSRIASALRR